MNKISAGRIVCAVIRDAKGALISRPAIITRIWDPNGPCVQATVFPDSANDGLGEVVGKSSLVYDETNATENSWHWPVVELPLAAKLSSVREVNWIGIFEIAYDLCQAIEQRLPSSGEATVLSQKASNLLQLIRNAATPQS